MAINIFNILAGIASIAGFAATIAGGYGVDMPGIIGAIASASAIWFPIVTLLLGFGLGWQMHEWYIKKNNGQSNKEIAEDIKLLNQKQQAILYGLYEANSPTPITNTYPFDGASTELQVLAKRGFIETLNRGSISGRRYILKKQILAFFAEKRNAKLVKECEDALERTMNPSDYLPVYRPETNTVENS